MSGVVRVRQHVFRWQEPGQGQLTLTYLLLPCCAVVLVTLVIHTVAKYRNSAPKHELLKSQQHLVVGTHRLPHTLLV